MVRKQGKELFKNGQLFFATGVAAMTLVGMGVAEQSAGLVLPVNQSVSADSVVPESTDTDLYLTRMIKFLDLDSGALTDVQPAQEQYVHFHNNGTKEQPIWQRISADWENALQQPDPNKYVADEKSQKQLENDLPTTPKTIYRKAVNLNFHHHHTEGVTAGDVRADQKNDLERTVTRTIKLMDGQTVKAEKTQTATLTRTATRDDATGTLSDFRLGSWRALTGRTRPTSCLAMRTSKWRPRMRWTMRMVRPKKFPLSKSDTNQARSQ